MGFYSPATSSKMPSATACMLPVDVTCSEWNCTLEAGVGRQPSLNSKSDQTRLWSGATDPFKNANDQRPAAKDLAPALRMGLRYVRGLREDAARSLLLERMRAPFSSIHDLARRVPELRKDELTTLAEIGALNSMDLVGISRLQIENLINPNPDQQMLRICFPLEA